MRTPEVRAYGGRRSGRSALTSGVAEFATPLAWRKPVTSHPVTPVTTKLNINVVTTSSTFHRALSHPGTALTSVPAAAPASRAVTVPSGPLMWAAVVAAARPPATNPPSTPMLKTPARKARAVARPVKRSGVAELRVAAIRSVPPKASRTRSW
ncbi:hypothetical protein GCM10029964_021860 [Kibdelosporangium lantanae]